MDDAKKGMIDKTISYIAAIPREPQDIMDPDTVLARLDQASTFDFEVLEVGFDEEEENPVVTVSYLGQTYIISVFAEEFGMDDLYTVNHRFTQTALEAIRKADTCLTTAMEFGTSTQESFLLQLKVLQCMVPDMIAVVDFCSERMLSAVWARMTTQSCVPPSPMYLYTVQGIEGDNDDVWLHTHGLNRCGLIELEILKSDTEHFQLHSMLLNAIANQTICRGELPDEGEPIFVAALPAGGALVLTWVDWSEAVKWYPAEMIGGVQDRLMDHNEDIGALYAYPNQKDYVEKNFVPICDLPANWLESPVLMVTAEETMRMSQLAMERLDFLRAGVHLPGSKAMVKVGLDVDAERREEAGSDTEHIWFQLEKLDEEFLYGTLTQKPYFIKGMDEGFKAKIPLRAMTDWSIDLGGTMVTPDSAYLLVWE